MAVAFRVVSPSATAWRLLAVAALLAALAPALAHAHPVAHRLELAPTGEGAGDQFGIVVGGPGDLNGDGYADMVVDGFLNDAAGTDAGRAYVYFGGPLLSATPSLVLTGEHAGDNFGVAKGAGDVNGDGYPDLIVGANQAGEVPLGPGKAYIFFGGPNMDNVPDLVLTGESPGDLFGSRVAGVGDVNGDGYDDVIVGAIGNAAHGPRTGRAYLYYGGPGMDAIPDMVFTGEAAYDEFGLVARGGDVNGDGYPDLIIGAWLNDGYSWDSGRAYLYFGGPGMDNVPDRVFTGEGPGDRFGVSVMGTGDVNGDGFADVIIGAYWNDAAGVNAGRAYVYFGGADMDTVPDVVLTGEHPDDGFGKSVCDAGDVNGDGYADVIVGAYTSDAGGYNSGCGYVFFGGPAMDATPDLVFPGEAAGDQLGYWVAGLGDVNGDGFGDVMIGASFNDAGAIDAGRAYLIDFNRYFVLAPNGGEVWTAGGFGAVTWTGGEPADVWVSGDDGATYQRVAMGVGGADTNRVLVNVPALPSDHARVRVTPTDTGVSGSDASDQAFRIVTPAGAPMSDAGALRFVAPCPNPATTTTRLVIDLPTAARVIVEAFDLSGRRVATPVAGELAPAGRFTRDWSLGALPEGVYRLRARVEDRELTRSLVRLASR